MKHSPQAAARRYARALLEVALAKGDPAQLREELEQGARLLEENDELRRVLTHPGVGSARRQALVKAIFESGSELLRRLTGLLAEKGSLELLPHVARAFTRAWNEQRGVLEAEAAAAVALDDAQRQTLVAALQKATGQQIELQTRVDAAVLGGLVVTMGGRTYDGSVRSQLRQLRQRLVGGGA